MRDTAIELSVKEQQVIQSVWSGHTDDEIAQGLGISINTVKSHLKNIYRKLAARNRIDALRISIEQGIIIVDQPNAH